jgi:Holliday junction resolvase RusA-like endonuclease
VTRSIAFEVSGEPVGKGRPRFVRTTGHAYTPEKTRNYETTLTLAAQDAMNGERPIEGPVSVHVVAIFGIGESWSRRKKAAALAGELRPAKKPDADNLLKMLDSCNGIIFRDDAQIVSATIEKWYGDRPRIFIEVFPWEGALLATAVAA